MDKNDYLRIALMLAQIFCLVLAVYVAYTMYQYNQGWNAGIVYAKSLNSTPCYLIKSGV